MSEPNLVDEWEECPLFAPVGAGIPQVASDTSNGSVSPAIGALSHLLYDEETPREIAEQLRDEGNRQFKRGIRYVLLSFFSVYETEKQFFSSTK